MTDSNSKDQTIITTILRTKFNIYAAETETKLSSIKLINHFRNSPSTYWLTALEFTTTIIQRNCISGSVHELPTNV